MPGPGAGKKGAQRTKGNLKPSSSSQAAQLLAASRGGTLSSGFIGFGSVSGAAAFVPVSQVLEEEESGLEPTFRVTLRKLSKRDSVTKLKALQEFSILCTESEEDVVKAALPFWPKIYNKLALDVDHKVREETQNALCALVSKVGRSLAPQLKFIMGSWLLSQCDTYPTVASAAQQAFSTAFPPAKQTDAILFCKDDIAEFLYENLVVQTASTLSDPKTCPAEDMEMKYNRVLTSSLLAWRRLLEVLTESTQGSVPDILNKLLSNPKLWKFSKSSVISVRAALYSFLSGICQHQTEVAVNFSTKMAPLALHSIDESDCQLCGALWETVLSVVTYLPDCWMHVNVQKAFIPKFRKLLQTGCHGNAAVIAPDLLPLLSKIPNDICGSRQKLIEEIFINMKQGLGLDSVRKSYQECGAMIKAFIECAQFSVKQSLSQEDSLNTAKYILFEQVLPLCEASLIDEHQSLFKSPLYDLIGQLLVSLSQSDNSNSDVVKSFREEITKLFLENISKCSQLTEGDPLQQRLSGFTQAIIVLKVSNISETKTKPQKSVMFADPDQDFSSKETNVKVPVKTIIVDSDIKVMVTKICLATYKHARHDKSMACLGLLKDIIAIYPDEEILNVLLESELVPDIEKSHEESQNAALMFVHKVCVPWISQIQTASDTSMETGITHLFDISMTMLAGLSTAEVERALSKLQKSLESIKLFQVLVTKCLVWRKHIPGISQWLHNEEFGERLVTVAQNVCQKSLVATETEKEELGYKWTLITSVLSSQDDKEAVLEQSVTERILGVIEETLVSLERSASSNKLEMAISFVTDVLLKFFCNLKGCMLVPSAERLLLTLFSLSLEQPLNISESCSKRLVESWQCGVQAIIQQRGGYLGEQGFLAMASQTITSQVRNTTSLQSLNKIYASVEVLVKTVRDNLPDDALCDPTLQALLNMLSTSCTEYIPPVQILQFLSLSEELLPNDQIHQSGNILGSTTSLAGVIYPSLFSARLLLFSKTGEFHYVPPKSSGTSSSSDLLITSVSDSPMCDWNDEDIPKLHYLFYNMALCEVWIDANKMTCNEKRKELKEMEFIAERLMASVTSDDTKSLVKLALHKSETNGWIWSKALSKLLSLIENVRSDLEFSPPDIVDRYASLTTSIVHTIQLTGVHLGLDERVQLTEIMVARVISYELTEDTDITEIAASLAVVRSLFSSFQKEVSTPELLSGLLEQLVSWRQDSFLSLSRETHTESFPTFNVELIRLLTHIVCTMPEILTDSKWDYILCTLIGWLQHVSDNESLLLSGKFTAQELCVCSCLLLVEVSECIQSKASIENSPLPGNLLTEWQEFFSEGSFSNLLPIFLKLTRSGVYKDGDGISGVVVSAVCHAVSQCPKQQILSLDLPTYLLADQDTNIPIAMQTLLNHICPMLQIKCRSRQIASYWLLNRVIGDIPAGDKAEDITSGDEQDDPTRSPPASLMKVLTTGASAMEVLLQDLSVEDCCFKAPPLTEEYHTVLTYLLSWKLLLNFFSHVPSEVKPQYAGYLKETGVVHTLLTDIFRLMPDKPSLPARPGVNLRENMFEVVPKLSALDGGYKQEIPHLACSVYRGLLEIMPAMTRQWWKDQDRKTAAYVDKYSMKYVSLLLCSSEIQSVQGTDVNLENITIKARATSREVLATYTLEEVRTEMVIALPANYPLGNITVTSEKRVGVTAAQWEKWLLQLNIFLQHQNGNIVDGLKMWKRNIDKRFEGVEECTICYSVIHGTTLQLPRLQCRTCKKKFHSACLYKWFSTSHQSTCPLCRNLF